MTRFVKVLILSVILGIPAIGSAQWVTEDFQLEPGWNAVWLPLDCSVYESGEVRTIKDVLTELGDPAINQIWRYNPLRSSTQFTESPAVPISSDIGWAVWRKGDPTNSTLQTLTGNAAYLIEVDSAASAFPLSLKGKPVPPSYVFSSNGRNFYGFPTPVTPPKFGNFLIQSADFNPLPEVFYYSGGSQTPTQFSSSPSSPTGLSNSDVVRGRAYWIKGTKPSNNYSEYYGPLQVTVLGSVGIDFGRKLNTSTLRIRNVTDPSKEKTVTASFVLVDSESPVMPPGQPAASVGSVDLRVRGARGADLQFSYTDIGSTTLSIPPGKEVQLVLDANRALMDETGKSYQSILRISDDLGHTRIDLPVSAIGSSRNGVWVGAALLNSVERVETLSGPEFDAAPGTPDSEGPETVTVQRVTTTIASDMITESTSRDVTFDAQGYASLREAGLDSSRVSVAAINSDGSTGPDYSFGTDYTLGTSMFADITDPGSGYTQPPTISLSGGAVGGGADVTAAVSAGAVTGITINDGGSGYTAPLIVEFTGGGGTGASATATLDSDGTITGFTIGSGGSGYTGTPVVTVRHTPATATATLSARVRNVRITNAGSGYTSAPTVTFSGGGGSGAAGLAIVSDDGYVTDVSLTSAGAGYGTPPTIGFTGGGGSGAAATAEIVGGIAGVSIANAGSSYTVAPSVVFTPVDGEGSGASANVVLGANGTVTGVDRIQRINTGSIAAGETVRITVTGLPQSAEGAPDRTTQSTITSFSRVVTRGGKSRVVTRRVSTGEAANAPSDFPVRLIFHAPGTGSPALLQRVYLGTRDGVAYAGTDETAVSMIVEAPGTTPDSAPGNLGRTSSAFFPKGGAWTAESGGSWGSGSFRFVVRLGHNDATNPFVHAYHPDHDNMDARFERPLPNKVESYAVTRTIDLNFSPELPPGVSDLTWGISTFGGTYVETISGLRTQDIVISGNFIIHQVSEAPVLTLP